MLQVTSQNLILKLNLYMEKKGREILLREIGPTEIVQGSKWSLNFFGGLSGQCELVKVVKKTFSKYIKLLEWSDVTSLRIWTHNRKKVSCAGYFCLFVLGLFSGGVGFISIFFVHFFYGSLQPMLFTPILSVNATLINIIVLHTHAHCLMWLNGDTWQENANIQLLKLCSMYRAWNYPSYTILFSSVISIFLWFC